MSAVLPSGVEGAFTVAASELGMCSAAWLFVREVHAELGDAGVAALRDRLGRTFPVLDAVALRWGEGERAPPADPEPMLEVCRGAESLVVVGLEAAFLDALLPALPDVRCALVRTQAFDVEWERVLANYDGRVEAVGVDGFQSFAGPNSVLFTFAYGGNERATNVLPTWLRVTGDDVRMQFRSLVAWDVLCAPMFVYPRWLVEVPASGFTHHVAARNRGERGVA